MFEDRPAVGIGAGTFRRPGCATAPTPASPATRTASCPRRSPTSASLGVALTHRAAARLAGGRRARHRPLPAPAAVPAEHGDPPPRRDWDGDRIALVAATLIAVVFGLQSAIDWTWFVPGPTAMALVAAGFVAGRAPARPPSPSKRRARAASPTRLRGRAACSLAAVLIAWAIWQPEAADRATGEAIRLADAGRSRCRRRRRPRTRPTPTRSAPSRCSCARRSRPRRTTSTTRGEALEQAVLKFPGESQTWSGWRRSSSARSTARAGGPDGPGRDLPGSAVPGQPPAVPPGAARERELKRAGRPAASGAPAPAASPCGAAASRPRSPARPAAPSERRVKRRRWGENGSRAGRARAWPAS